MGSGRHRSGGRSGRRRWAEEVGGGFGHDDLHDGFAGAGAGDATGFQVRVAATADKGRIADAAGEFAASASGGGGGEKFPMLIVGHRANGALCVAAMV